MRGQIARHDTLAALDQRHAVILQDLGDLVGLILKGEIEHVFQKGVSLAHADAEIELKRRLVFPEIYRLHHDRFALGLAPAGERPPDGGDIEVAVHHLLHLPIGLMLGLQVGVMGDDGERDVVDNAVAGENLAHAGRLEHANPQLLELRVVEAFDVDAFVIAVGQHVGGAVDRHRGEQRAVGHGNVDHHIAHAGVEGLSR